MKSKTSTTILIVSLIFTLLTTSSYAQDLQSAIKYSKSEQYDQAEEIFAQITQKEPNNSNAFFYFGENCLSAYFADTISNTLKIATDQARELYLKGVKADTLNPLNYIGLAKIYYYLGDDKNAAAMRAKAKSFLPAYKYISKIKNPKPYAFTLIKIAESYIRDEKIDSAAAMPLMREALKIDPKSPDNFIIAGDIYLLSNDGTKAINSYGQAQYLDPKSPAANMKIGSIYMKGRNLMAAIPYYEEAIKIDQTYAPAYRELGQLYSMAGKYDKSKEYFKTYLELTKGNIPAKIRYVNSLFYAKEYNEVITNVEEIFAIDQSRTYLNRIAAYSCYESTPPDYIKGISYIETLFSKLQADRLLKKDYMYYARLLLKKNEIYPDLLKDTVKLSRDINKLQDKLIDAVPALKTKMKLQLDTMNIKFADKVKLIKDADVEIDKAFAQYRKALEMKPGDIETLNEMSVNYYTFKRFSYAAKTAEELIALGRNDVSNYMQVGKSYYQAKMYNQADSIFTLVTQKFPDYMQGYVWIANTYAGMDPDSKQGLAKPKYEMVIEKCSIDTIKYTNEIFQAYSYLGAYYLLIKDDYPNAKIYSYKMISLNPEKKENKTKGYTFLALMYSKMVPLEKETEGKIAMYRKSLEMYSKILEYDAENKTAKVASQDIKKRIDDLIKGINPDEIKGWVKNSSGKPIAGASVRVKDTALESSTGADGNYKFEISKDSEFLEISAPGYKTKEIPVTQKQRIYNITLEK